jgi:hypothetical protein
VIIPEGRIENNEKRMGSSEPQENNVSKVTPFYHSLLSTLFLLFTALSPKTRML